MLVMVVSRGFDLGLVIDLPVPNFSALVESVDRVRADDEMRAVFAARAAAHADKDEFSEFISKTLEPRAGRRLPTRSPEGLGGGF